MAGRKFNHLFVLGITGGVGAGKSTVLQYLRDAYGAAVIECDDVGRSLQMKGGACYEPMLTLFGPDYLQKDGQFDRGKLARLVYQDPRKKKMLEEIVLPAVKEEVRSMLQALDRGEGSALENVTGSACPAGRGLRLAVIEAALLIDDHYEDLCDEIWYIYAADDVRRARLKKSRGYSDERIDRMFAAQRSDISFRQHTQFTIDNTSDIVQNTLKQLDRALEERFKEGSY